MALVLMTMPLARTQTIDLGPAHSTYDKQFIIHGCSTVINSLDTDYNGLIVFGGAVYHDPITKGCTTTNVAAIGIYEPAADKLEPLIYPGELLASRPEKEYKLLDDQYYWGRYGEQQTFYST